MAARKYESSCPDDEQARLVLAMILGDAGKLREAIPLATKAARSRSDDASAQYGLGLLLARDNKLDSSLKSFRKAVELRPDYVEALEYIAYLGTDEPPARDIQAIDDVMTSGQHAGQPGEAALWYARAALLEREGDYESAFDNYGRGASLMRSFQKIDLEAMESYIERLRRPMPTELVAAGE
jgi:tetratricopeptide (TPR) repeat protein